MADDLKNMDSDLLKASCFLADAPENNAAKADLTRKMTDAKREFADAIDEENITADQINNLLQATKDLIDEVKEVQNSLNRQVRNNPSKEDQIRPQIELAEELLRIIGNRERTFRKLAKGI